MKRYSLNLFVAATVLFFSFTVVSAKGIENSITGNGIIKDFQKNLKVKQEKIQYFRKRVTRCFDMAAEGGHAAEQVGIPKCLVSIIFGIFLGPIGNWLVADCIAGKRDLTKQSHFVNKHQYYQRYDQPNKQTMFVRHLVLTIPYLG